MEICRPDRIMYRLKAFSYGNSNTVHSYCVSVKIEQKNIYRKKANDFWIRNASGQERDRARKMEKME